MNLQNIMNKVARNEGLTVEEVMVYEANVNAEKQVYGKYGTLAKQYLVEHNFGKLLALENLSDYLHGIDRQADEMYESMYAKLSNDERYRHTSDFIENYRRITEINRLIEEEIMNELVYVA